MIIHTYSPKKRKSRKPTADQRQLAAEWDAIVKKYEPKKPVKYKAVTWQPTKSYVRETPHIPSLSTAGGSATTSRLITRSYSGTGGGTAGGSATTSKSATRSYTGSGGATAGGSATLSRIVIKLYSGSGGGVAGGSAVYEKYITYIIASIAFELAMLNAEATVTAEQLRAKVKITEEKIVGSGTAGGAYVNYIS